MHFLESVFTFFLEICWIQSCRNLLESAFTFFWNDKIMPWLEGWLNSILSKKSIEFCVRLEIIHVWNAVEKHVRIFSNHRSSDFILRWNASPNKVLCGQNTWFSLIWLSHYFYKCQMKTNFLTDDFIV